MGVSWIALTTWPRAETRKRLRLAPAAFALHLRRRCREPDLEARVAAREAIPAVRHARRSHRMDREPEHDEPDRRRPPRRPPASRQRGITAPRARHQRDVERHREAEQPRRAPAATIQPIGSSSASRRMRRAPRESARVDQRRQRRAIASWRSGRRVATGASDASSASSAADSAGGPAAAVRERVDGRARSSTRPVVRGDSPPSTLRSAS